MLPIMMLFELTSKLHFKICISRKGITQWLIHICFGNKSASPSVNLNNKKNSGA